MRTVQAQWSGPFPAEIPHRPGVVEPGETVEIPEAQLDGAHWQPVEQPRAKKAAG